MKLSKAIKKIRSKNSSFHNRVPKNDCDVDQTIHYVSKKINHDMDRTCPHKASSYGDFSLSDRSSSSAPVSSVTIHGDTSKTLNAGSYAEFVQFLSMDDKAAEASNGNTRPAAARKHVVEAHLPTPKPFHGASHPAEACTHAVETHSTTSSGRCPFYHGTVYAGPYPGYVHGNPIQGICPSGCRPELNSDITQSESPKETLLREATEYIELYYHERQDEMKGSEDLVSKEQRMCVIRESIENTGTYEHTFDELQHGARIAWRNAPKCSNRKYWEQVRMG